MNLSNIICFRIAPLLFSGRRGGYFLFCVSHLVFLSSSPSFAIPPNNYHSENPYQGAFTRKIYDQPDMDRESQRDPEEIDRECLKHLREKKERAFNENYGARMQIELRILKGQLENDETYFQRERVIGMVSDLLTIDLVSVFGHLLLNPISYFALKDYDPPLISATKSRIRFLKETARNLLEGLNHERVSELEQRYVVRKRHLDKRLQNEIEDALLETRNTDIYYFILKQFLEKSLNLPISSKRLLGDDVQQSIMALRRRYYEDQKFQMFSGEIQDELFNIVRDMAFASIADDTCTLPLRQRLFFWGNPGGGKSTAASHLGEFLSIPVFPITIIFAEELSQKNLVGTTYYHPPTKLGWFAGALLEAGYDTKKTYKNAVLVINDFDRVLFGKKGGPALALLLDLLDPSKKEIHHSYFGCPIDISRLHIIITSNMPIPVPNNPEDRSTPRDTYAALRDRVRTVEFPELSEEKYRGILRKDLPALHRFYHLPTWVDLSYTDDDYLIVTSTLENTESETLEAIPLREHPLMDFKSIRNRKNSLQRVFSESVGERMGAAEGEFNNAQECLTERRQNEAKELFLASAKKGKIVSVFLLAGLEEDPALRRYYYEKGAENDHVGSLRELGKLRMQAGETEPALENLRRAAIKGDGEAYFCMGGYYFQENEDDEAETNYNRAIEVGYSQVKLEFAALRIRQNRLNEAQTFYTELLDEGVLLPQTAQAYYELGGRFEELEEKKVVYEDLLRRDLLPPEGAETFYRLGEEFEKRDGISLQNENALQCYRNAAQNDHFLSHVKLGMTPCWDDSSTHTEAQINSLRVAAEQENPIAINILGFLTQMGRGIGQNLTEAVRLYRQAKDDCLVVKYNLALCYQNGRGVRCNHTLAQEYLQDVYRALSTAQDEASLQALTYEEFHEQPYGMHEVYAHLLAEFYFGGWGGCVRDLSRAEYWARIAARAGYRSGKETLANIRRARAPVQENRGCTIL